MEEVFFYVLHFYILLYIFTKKLYNMAIRRGEKYL